MEQQCFLSSKNRKETIFKFLNKFCHNHINNENTENLKLLNGSDNENSKFEAKKQYIIYSKISDAYAEDDPIKFLTKSIESSLCDYSDEYILVMGNITSGGNDTIHLKIVLHLENAEQK